jgi:hypothetical protein
MKTATLPYTPSPHDTPAGHSFAAAWIVLFAFCALDVLIAFQWAAMNHFFG